MSCSEAVMARIEHLERVYGKCAEGLPRTDHEYWRLFGMHVAFQQAARMLRQRDPAPWVPPDAPTPGTD